MIDHNKRSCAYRANFAACVQLMHAAPRTVIEISHLLGIKYDTARIYVRLLEDEGLIKPTKARVGCKSHRGIVYAWNHPEPAAA